MAWYDLLRKSIERELNAGQIDIIEKLDVILKDWQHDKNIPVSFATAVMLENEQVIKAANGLPEPDNTPKKTLYKVFKQLTATKPKKRRGEWPWAILRKEDKSKSGIFPPQVLLLDNQYIKKCSATTCIDLSTSTEANDINLDDMANDFANGNDHTNNSWKWYAAYPAILGDAIRGDKKKTVALVYILGTRREFLQRERTRDYGLIVGLTKDAFQNERCLKPAADAILAAWNILAVSPHVVSDGQKMVRDAKKIAGLEAAQQLTHTFRTYVDAHALQQIKNWVRGSENEKDIVKKVESISSLAGMMAFVAKDGINNENEKLRAHEIEKYDLVKFISEVFTKELENGIPKFPEPSINKPSKESFNGNGTWIPRLYLRAALMEIIKNIRQKAPKNDKINITIECDENNLEVTVINRLSVGSQSSGGKNKKVSGSHALNAFFSALGGKAEGDYSDANGNFSNSKGTSPMHYTWKVSYNLQAWEKKVKECKKQPDTTQDMSGGYNFLTPDDIPEICEPSKGTIGLRVLVLDDELDANDLRDAFKNLNYFEEDNNGGKKYLWGWYKREFKKGSIAVPLICFYNKTMKMEVVCCPSVWWAKEVLFGEYFDIALLDIDFGKDPAGLPPTLGGLLFGIGFLNTEAAPSCILHVFTAKGPNLRRDNPDFRYLEELARNKMLGKLEFQADNASKDLGKMLCQAFYTWCKDVLGYRGKLDVDPSSLIKLGDFLYIAWDMSIANYEGTQNKILKPVKLYFDQRQGLCTEIPIETFDVLIPRKKTFGELFDKVPDTLKDEPIRKMLGYELSKVCGHAIVRNLFCTYAHGKLDEYLFGKDESEFQPLFDEEFKKACTLFGIKNADKFKEKLKHELKTQDIDAVKKHYRVEVKNLFPDYTVKYRESDKKTPIFLFGLWEKPDQYMGNLESCLVDFLKDRNKEDDEFQPKIKTIQFEDKTGWVIRLIGNRTDNNFMHTGSGGTLNDLLNENKANLKIIASAVIARSKNTCFDLLRKHEVYCNCTDNNRIRQKDENKKPCCVDCGFSKNEGDNKPSSLELLIVLHHNP